MKTHTTNLTSNLNLMKKTFSLIALMLAIAVSFFDTQAAVMFAVVTPQAVQADYFQNIVTTFDLNIKKVLPKLYARYGDQGGSTIDMLMSLGYERTDSVPTIYHFEENWIHQSFKVLAHAAGSAGAAVTLTIHPDSLDASNRFYPRLQDTLTLPNESTATIISISTAVPSAPTITIACDDQTKAVPAFVGGQPLAITGNKFSEGSTQPAGRFSGAWQYTNNTQIVKESIGASGTQMTNESWVKIADGKGIEGWFQKGLMDIERRQKINVQGTFMTQEIRTNPLVVDNLNSGASITTTEAFFPYLRRLGIPYGYSPGTLTIQDANTWERLLSRQFANRTVMGLLGQDVDLEIEDMMVAYLANTNISFTAETENNKLFGDSPEGKATAASIGFSYIMKGQRKYALKRFEALNDPQTYGAANYPYPGKFTFVPLGMNKDKKNSDKQIPSMGIVWKGMSNYNRRMEMFDLGGAGVGTKTTPVDRRDWYMRCEFSTEFFGGNQMVDGFIQ